MKTKLYILDPYPIVAEGLKCIAAQDQQLQFIGETESTKTALAEIPKLKPHLVIIEVTLKDASGTEVIKRLRQANPDLKILVFSAHDENTYAERCLRAGAMGYLMKTEKPKAILQAIHQVLAGGSFSAPAS